MRKLIRPTREEFDRLKKLSSHSSVVTRRRSPAAETGHETVYLQQHSQHQTPMVVRLTSGEEIRGWIEYYDLNFIRITMERGPNRFVFKHDILYMHEDMTALKRRRLTR
jgi:sRNA-binding regulator protein Hfq